MQLFEKENARTRSKITRGVAPKPNHKGQAITFRSSQQKRNSKAWKGDVFEKTPLTSEMEHMSSPTTWEGIHPEVILPGQLDTSPESSPEFNLAAALFFQSLDRLRWTFQPVNESIDKSVNPILVAEKKKEEQGDLLAWFSGAKALFSFKETAEYIGSDHKRLIKLIKIMCASWAETDGAVPDIDFNRSINVPPTERVKPEPIFEGRCAYLKELNEFIEENNL